MKICEEKELNKHLSFVNRTRITEDKERQAKAINLLIMFNNKNFKSCLSQYYMLSRYWNKKKIIN
jgi:hypothetical protein